MRAFCISRVLSADFFFFSSRRRHTSCLSDWSSDVCSSDLLLEHLSWDGDLRHLEDDIASVAHHLRADLDQLLLQARQRPVLDVSALAADSRVHLIAPLPSLIHCSHVPRRNHLAAEILPDVLKLLVAPLIEVIVEIALDPILDALTKTRSQTLALTR